MQSDYEAKLVESSDDKLEEVTRMQQVFAENKQETDKFLQEIMVGNPLPHPALPFHLLPIFPLKISL